MNYTDSTCPRCKGQRAEPEEPDYPCDLCLGQGQLSPIITRALAAFYGSTPWDVVAADEYPMPPDQLHEALKVLGPWYGSLRSAVAPAEPSEMDMMKLTIVNREPVALSVETSGMWYELETGALRGIEFFLSERLASRETVVVRYLRLCYDVWTEGKMGPHVFTETAHIPMLDYTVEWPGPRRERAVVTVKTYRGSLSQLRKDLAKDEPNNQSTTVLS